MSKIRKRLVQEGEYVAEVEITLIEEEGGWSPYVSLEDAYKLDDAREALRSGDIESASKIGQIYKLTPIASGHR
jgi:sirohydrochlorin ferrochelatase